MAAFDFILIVVITCPPFCFGGLVDRKQNGGLAGSGTQGSRPVPLDTLSRSKASKMRLHSTRPHKRIKRGIYLY